MAILFGGALGFASGKAGNIIFCTRDGRTYFYIQSEKEIIITSEKVKTNNRNFAFLSSYAAAAGKLNLFSQLWKSSFVEGRTIYNKILSVNLKKVKPDYDISGLFLLPFENKFITTVTDIHFQNESTFITVSPYNEIITGEKLISVQGVLMLTEPYAENLKPYHFIPVHSRDITLEKGTSLQFEIKYSNQSLEFIKQYGEKKMLLNLIIKDTQGKPEKFSVEFYIQLE